MDNQELEQIKYHFSEAAKLLFKNTSPEKLKDFDSIEMILREYLLEIIAPLIASFFLHSQLKQQPEKPER